MFLEERVPVNKRTGAPFAQKTPEFKFPKQMFDGGDVLASDKPTDICHRVDKFQKHTADQFHSQFNKLKASTGLHTREVSRTKHRSNVIVQSHH
jgi:hypothetical protein